MKKIILLLFVGVSVSAFAQYPCIPPVVTVTGSAWKCHGEKDTLTVSGTSGNTYLWNNGSTRTTYITGDIDADSTISVIGTNGGCSDTAYFTIILKTPPVITTAPIASCTGLPIELVPNITGTGPFTYSWSTGATTDSIGVPSPADSTHVTYTLTVSNGCSSANTFTVTAEFPTLSACCTSTVSVGNNIILSASGNCISYAWQPSSSAVCLNTSCDSVRVSPAITTTYSVTGTDAAGCQVTGFVTVIVEPAGIPTINGSDFVNIYPNPSSSAFTVTLRNKTEIKLCDITGRMLFSELENAGNVIFGKGLNPGIYFLFIDGKPGIKIVKL
jgi:hypothetical protein